MTKIMLDTSRDIATVPLDTRILRTIDTPSGPATETSTGWFVAPYAPLINIGGQLKPNPVTVESAAALKDEDYVVPFRPNGHPIVQAGDFAGSQRNTYYGYGDPSRTRETYQNTTFYGTGYEGDRFVFGGMGLDSVKMFTTAPELQTNSVGMSKWLTPAGHEVITFGVEQLDFLDNSKPVTGIANEYEWTYTEGNWDGFVVSQFDDLAEVAKTPSVDFAYVHQNIGDWNSRIRVGEQWYSVEPGKTTAINVPEYLIGQDTGYQFSSTGELLRELPWSTSFTPPPPPPAPAPAPVTPPAPTTPVIPAPEFEFGSPVAPAVTAPAKPPQESRMNEGNTINITINGDNNTFGDIFIGVKNGRDKLTGTDGDDILTSNRGRDVLTGGDGADDFVIAGDGKDKIKDYDESEGDTLAIDEALVEELANPELVVVDTGSEYRAIQDDSLVYRENRGTLMADGDLIAKLSGAPELTEVIAA